MSKVSIYENSWLDLVFEGRNKEYGAYQLRQESPKTTMIALFMGMLFITTVVSIPMIVSYFGAKEVVEIPDEFSVPVQVTDLSNQPQKPEQQVAPTVTEPETEVLEKEQLVNPVIVAPTDANQNIATNEENATPKTENPTGTTGTNTNPTTGGTGPTTTTPTVDYGTAVAPSFALDKLPEFPGGMSKFYNYVGNNFEKPSIDLEKTVTVYVAFVIEKDGSMTDIKVMRNPGYGLDKEAIRVLKSLKTKWKPGMIGGKAVRTSYNLPITVKMESN